MRGGAGNRRLPKPPIKGSTHPGKDRELSMIRTILAAALALACALAYSLLFSVPSWSAGLHPRCNVDWPCSPEILAKSAKKSPRNEARRIARADRYRNVEFGSPMYPPETARSFLSGRPSGCPARAWCGCWLAKHLGLSDRSLWLARRWATIGSNAGGPQVGAIVVWRHHVGKITAVDGHRIRVLSGNDGGAVRDRWRTTAGVIAYRFAS